MASLSRRHRASPKHERARNSTPPTFFPLVQCTINAPNAVEAFHINFASEWQRVDRIFTHTARQTTHHAASDE